MEAKNQKGVILDRVAQIIRVLTIPPVLAVAAVLLIYFNGEPVGGIGWYLAILLFVAVIPTVAYPIQHFIPKYKGTGRKGQRKLAFIFSAIGYFSGLIFGLITRAKGEILAIYLCYAFSLMNLIIFNKCLKIRASGHACGFLGPLALCVVEIGIPYIVPALILFVLMVWSSIRLKRHTPSELLFGSICSLVAVTGVELLMYFL